MKFSSVSLQLKRPYRAPGCRKVSVRIEGVLCASGDSGNTGEDFDEPTDPWSGEGGWS